RPILQLADGRRSRSLGSELHRTVFRSDIYDWLRLKLALQCLLPSKLGRASSQQGKERSAHHPAGKPKAREGPTKQEQQPANSAGEHCSPSATPVANRRAASDGDSRADLALQVLVTPRGSRS